MLERGSGVLLHVSSLPGYGPVGNIGTDSQRFLRILKKSEQKYWQILPLNPVDQCSSPYSPKSAFAGETALIDPRFLEISELYEASRSLYEKSDFARAKIVNQKYIKSSYESDRCNVAHEIDNFKRDNDWIEDYAMFTALRNHFKGELWINWPKDIRFRNVDAMNRYKNMLYREIDFIEYSQYIFFKQWDKLKECALEAGINIIGDVPIYVPLDSADVWANPDLFQLDENLKPQFVSGAPPDFFSEGGQKWDMPLYRWDKHEKTGFDWWLKRISHSFKMFDVLRLDHFRGFEAYWSIPSDDMDARNGHWEKGPGKNFLKVLKDNFTDKGFIVEDLGDITPKVRELKEYFGYPGMSVLQFAFDGNKDNLHLPSNSPENSVVYTGTHDNAPLPLWLDSLDRSELEIIKKQLNAQDGDDVADKIIEEGFKSHCLIAIIQLQDILPLDRNARMNLPGTNKDNWKYKVPMDINYSAMIEKLKKIADLRK